MTMSQSTAALEPSNHPVPRDFRHHHAIIGAGFCGLGVAAAFQRHGIPYHQFEADDDVGGNWYHGVYQGVHIISSRKTTEYTDWPMPADWPDFPSAEQMLTYLHGYADHWNLRPHIAFQTRIEHVRPFGEDRHRGQWELTLAGGERRIYGGVIVANGHHWHRRMPSYRGTFAGDIIHSKDYKHRGMLAGKRVLVIGGGNSACDIAVEAARSAQSAHISMRRGYWFMPKTMFGRPTVEFIRPWLPVASQRILLKALIRVIVGRYRDYGLPHPDHNIFERHPTINSELLHFLRHGRIVPHTDVDRYHGHTVHFQDGTAAEIDLIICATGYHVSFPFVAEEVVEWNDSGMPNLIASLLPPQYKNIYFFGITQPRYGAGPLISAGAEAVCTAIDTQKRLKHPLGAVLERLGATAPTTWLRDPHEVMRTMKRSQAIMPQLPQVEEQLMGPKHPGQVARAFVAMAPSILRDTFGRRSEQPSHR